MKRSTRAAAVVRAVVAWLACVGVALGLGGAACEPKVPIVDVGARFVIAEATWFEAEETLFVFYRVNADQGLSDASQIEVSFLTTSSTRTSRR